MATLAPLKPPPVDAFAFYRLWWSDLPSRHAQGTVRRWRYLVLRTFADLGVDPLTVTQSQISRYLDGYRSTTANMIRLALVDFFGFLHRRGYRAEHLLALERPRRRTSRLKVKRSLTEDELTRLLVALTYLPPRFPWSGERVALLALAQYLTGLRPGELLSLTRERIHLDDATASIEVVETKTGDDRVVPLSSRAREVFALLSRDRQGRIADFGTTRYHELVHRAALIAGLPKEKARPYALRHTFARTLIDRGVDERTVADLLGHRDLRHIWGYSVPAHDQRRSAVELL